MTLRDTPAAREGDTRTVPPAGCGLSRALRVDQSQHFKDAFDRCPGFRGRFLVLWWRHNDSEVTRLGVVASRKSFRRAVDRARAKRLLREAFRLNRHRLRIGVDVILVARHMVLDVKRQPVEADLLDVARRAGILGKA